MTRRSRVVVLLSVAVMVAADGLAALIVLQVARRFIP